MREREEKDRGIKRDAVLEDRENARVARYQEKNYRNRTF